MIYKIEHYYHYGKEDCKYAIFIESDIEPEKMANIIGAIQLKFETTQNKEDDIDEIHLLELLKSYYGVIDVKEKYKHVLKQTVIEDDEWERIVHIPIVDGENTYVIILIDLYSARDFLCGPNYEDSFKYLPDSEKFLSEVSDLSEYYLF